MVSVGWGLACGELVEPYPTNSSVVKKANFLGGEIMLRMVVVLMIVGLCVHTAAALPGSGTPQDPWRIESLADFDEFAADPNYWAGFTRLETDVNLAGRTYSTAVIAPDVNNANYDFDGTAFTGVFDGNDHKITNLTIDGGTFLGLFGCIEEDGEVRNLGLEDGSVSGDYYVSGLVGFNSGSILNCYSTGDVSGTWNYVGGLVGINFGTVSNSYCTGSVHGDRDVGGLMGKNDNGIVLNCYSTGSISGYGFVGGLVGKNDDDGSVSNCYSTSPVSGSGSIGGLVGSNEDDGSISNCYSIGDVNGYAAVGGLVGNNIWGASISNCYSTGDVNGVDDVGGLVGYYGARNVERSFWDVQTSGKLESAGGTGKTTAEMQTKSTFTEAGWDFVEIWGIGEHQTYPYLRFAPAGDFNYDKEVNFLDLAILASHWLEEK
jgi:hypothetical protein